jgi:hypothetical protein
MVRQYEFNVGQSRNDLAWQMTLRAEANSGKTWGTRKLLREYSRFRWNLEGLPKRSFFSRLVSWLTAPPHDRLPHSYNLPLPRVTTQCSSLTASQNQRPATPCNASVQSPRPNAARFRLP